MNKLENCCGLWIGNSADARNEAELRKNGITSVVNVAKDLNDPWFSGIKSYKLGLDDGGSNTTIEYLRIMRFICDLLKQNEIVLLHCHEGRSRTAAIATGIMTVMNFFFNTASFSDIDEELKKSLEYVAKVRPLCASLNREHLSFIKEAVIMFVRFE